MKGRIYIYLYIYLFIHSFIHSTFHQFLIHAQLFGRTPDMESLLLTHEIFWQHTLLTFEPYGMNKSDEGLYSSRTIF